MFFFLPFEETPWHKNTHSMNKVTSRDHPNPKNIADSSEPKGIN
jgi:hypothetical protein